ncbi:MAG: hypothetical protein JXA33_20260 [Anaerolineae bacterium]|nr:hypothetical protein [Anaerolineae bacterium]
MRDIDVDLEALIAAFEYASDEVDYYLDLETGHVLMVTRETRWELEAIYEEFYDPETDEDFDLTAVLNQRNLPEWRKQALLEADRVEEYYITRYIDIPQTYTGDSYADMQSFIRTIEDKPLRQHLWELLSGRGAFRRFKDTLLAFPDERNRWFSFSSERARQRALNWLATQQIQVIQDWNALSASSQSGPSPRARLIAEALNFTRTARSLPGVERIALIGSLVTAKPEPKDVDLLVTVADNMLLAPLAELGRKLSGHTQSFNRGGDIFLANVEGDYLGRTCPWKRCGPGIRATCDALHCGQRLYLHDDFQTIRLSTSLITSPPLELWPEIVIRVPLPKDIQLGLIAPLRAEVTS